MPNLLNLLNQQPVRTKFDEHGSIPDFGLNSQISQIAKTTGIKAGGSKWGEASVGLVAIWPRNVAI